MKMKHFWKIGLLVLALVALTSTAFAEYRVTYTGTGGASGPLNNDTNVAWATGDVHVVNPNNIGFYNDNPLVFTVTEVTATGAELNAADASVNEALMTMGTGADGMDAYGYSVETVGGIKVTRILLDIDGLNAGATADDIIGEDGIANATIGQVTAAVNGTIYAGTVECMQIAAGGDTTISFQAGDQGTVAEDAAKSTLTNGVELLAGLNCSGLNRGVITLPLAADKYLYLSGDTGGNATYTAGILLITLYGL